MAVFNEIQEQGLNQALVQRLGMKQGGPIPALAPELFPGITLESDRPEWGFLKGERLCSVWFNVAAVAAQYSCVQVYLPTNAQCIAVVEQIRQTSSSNCFVGWGVGISGGLAGWSAAVTGTRDSRWNKQGSAVIAEQLQSAAAPSLHSTLFVLGQTTSIDTPLVISPGQSLILYSRVVNQLLDVSIQWRERVAQRGELV